MYPDRYARQVQLPQIGARGQERLSRATVAVVGCGALGCALAELLARAGIGRLKIADRDLVEPTNLQRQLLFDEADAAAGTPKAHAAAARLARINSQISIEAHAIDVGPGNVERLLDGVDLALDGADNAETRYLLNDACVKLRLPWIYGGA
ncbi:MAG: HesA/MoeB/ThiF family protein, partial [Deltaproteobacteria bacterium]|nr:HesA/MoeB/ThiF family protein [Deltaproteobacteria bacterium]